MAPTTSEDTVKFLVACIQHSTAGKTNWQGMADKCGIPTKNAASMRYSRLLKAHGVTNPVAPGAASRANTPDNSPVKPRVTRKKKTPKKKQVQGQGGGGYGVAEQEAQGERQDEG